VNDDGVADLVVAEGNSISVLVSTARRASVPVPSLAGRGHEVRSVPASPLDLGLVSPRLPQDPRLARASLAYAFTPESATLSSPGPITLPLHSSLTEDELTWGVFRVFRDEPQLVDSVNPTSQIDRRFGRRSYSRIVEAARRDPQNPTGSSFPANVVPASVDPIAGTITFMVTRLGRYQVFLEAHPLSFVAFRETFDAAGPDALGNVSRPPGWFGNENWQVGRAPIAGLFAGSRPGPASAPNLLAIGLRRDYRNGADDAIVSREFLLDWTPADRRTVLRLREWHDLEANLDFGDLTLIARKGAATERRLVKSYTGRTQVPLELVGDDIDVTDELDAALTALNVTQAEFRLELRLRSNATVTGSGWLVDDIEIVVEPQ
jgi:hypothetical protein